jgi:hypothetical protein
VPDQRLDTCELMRPTQVVAEFIALSVVESTFRPGLRLTVKLSGPEALLIDTGRGMKIEPDEGDSMTHAQRVLTSDYPIVSADEKINQILTNLVWGARGSLGPARANRSCQRLEYASRRGGIEWRQTFVSAQPSGPPVRSTTIEPDGTLIHLTAHDSIDAEHVERLASDLNRAIETISITLMNE